MTPGSYVLWLVFVVLAVGVVVTWVRRLANIERKLDLVIEHLDIEGSTRVAPSDHVVGLASNPDQRIAAIKAYRDETGAGLKEAVVVVDRIAGGARNART